MLYANRKPGPVVTVGVADLKAAKGEEMLLR